MSKLRELEKRLRNEPENLGLRVMVAGAMHEAGRRGDAVELYRSVAIAYREQGRAQQALMVCRSILELAPDDASCKVLLAALVASQPAALGDSDELARRRSSGVTPLPPPLPYHVADPSIAAAAPSRSDLPPSLREELERYPDIAGIANAARQISDSLIAANRQGGADEDAPGELGTRRISRRSTAELGRLSSLTPTAPVDRVPQLELGTGDDDDAPTLSPARGTRRDRTGEVERPTLPLSSGLLRGLLGDDDPTLLVGQGAPHARMAGDDDVTLPPITGSPRARIFDDDKTSPRGLPTRGAPPSPGAPVPPATPTEPLSGAFFAPIPPHSRATVLQRFRRRIVAAGTAVIRRGEVGHGLVIVLRGRLEVQLDRADGARVSLGAIVPGQYVGEASLLARAPGGTHVVAAVDSELMVLAAGDFYDVTGAFSALRAELKAVAALRTREYEQHMRGSG